MWTATLLVFLLTGITQGRNHFVSQTDIPSLRNGYRPITLEGDMGCRLILTPYIESGNIKEARELSSVRGSYFSGITSYSGFFTVNKQHNSNLFFWFFPAESNVEMKYDHGNAPVLLWLQGGPGSTSLFGLFNEIGPFSMAEDKSTLMENPYSWHKNHSVIFIDNPVGTGFSFTENDEGYAKTQTQIGSELYVAITQFFKMFQEYKSLSFFIVGESYAGKYIPSLAYVIHKNNSFAENKVNLQGIAIGNGFTDPVTTFSYSQFLYQFGVIDINACNEMIRIEERGKLLLETNDFMGAYEKWNEVLDIYERATKTKYLYNILQENEAEDLKSYENFVQRENIRKCLHVGDTPFYPWSLKAYQHLKLEFMKSVRPMLEELLEHYRVLYYSGQLDIIVAYPLSVNMYNKLQFSAAEEYRNATRVPWYVDGQLAGYMKSGGKFTEVLVRNAGHMVPADQPSWAFDLINKFTRDYLKKLR